MHRVHILEANGPSYWLRESKRGLQRRDAKPPEPDRTDPEEPGVENVSKK
jgi:hypothetical protein